MTNRLLLLATWSLLAGACTSAGDSSDPADPNAQMAIPMATGSGGQSSTPMMTNSAGMSAAKPPAPGAEPPGPAPAAEPPGPAAKPDPNADPKPMAGTEPPFGADADVIAWTTDRFTLDAGQERDLCFAKTLAEDLVINGYASNVQPFVHHLIFSRDSAPEPDGFYECDFAFRNSWEPVFITGAGDSKLELPADAGHELTKGTQMVVQMHLLNLTEEPAEGSVTINMRRSSVSNPRPVNTFIFGTAAVELPAAATTEVIGTCSPFQSVHLIAGFPHMHMLGTSLHFEVGPSESEMKEVFKRDPFDFNNQRIDSMDFTVEAGDVTRVTCTFDNKTDATVGYGESTKNEMCYFVGFAIDQPSQSACLEVLPPSIFQ